MMFRKSKIALVAAVIIVFGEFNQGRAETLVTDLSQHLIEITSQFSGRELLLFGALERHAMESIQSDDITVQGLDYDIIVVVQSSPTDVVIRKKNKVAGIWINSEDQIIRGVPGYYVIGSTRPLDEFLSKKDQSELGLGLENLRIVNDDGEEIKEYKEALIRNMIENGLYKESSGNVMIKDEILFRANLAFPSNMPVGNYTADVYLVRDSKVIINHRTDLLVDKRGLERFIFNFAHDYPPYYGIIVVILAISIGLFTGFVAKKVA
ncbi:MAG TPA: TIGR02186 family protein [Emcibacteraceae bacterium]|nr:TIGR02186 family protein [Emcibacteraceae bacterium]HRW28506.1 TIGR02186 family protein [Emcibacteraceae bacterium]